MSLIGRFPALAGVDLEVAPAEVVLLQGPNGAGKTTILRCCAGLMAVTSGEARCSAWTSCATGARCAGGSACSATPAGSTTS